MADTCMIACGEEILDPQLPEIVLFVCTGNTCRSPMAAALFNHLFTDRGIAVSAGLAADGSPISANAVHALRQREIPSSGVNDYEKHVSRTVTPELMRSAGRVIGISARHAMALMSAFPEYAEKIGAMPVDIADPYGGSAEEYVRCLAEIEAAEKELFGRDGTEN